MATEFVRVRHEDGREADITKAEVASYREMGFTPVKGEAAEPDAAAATTAAAVAASTDGETVRLREPGAQTEPKAADKK